MSIIKTYSAIRDILNEKPVDNKIVEDAMEYIVSVLETWLDSGEFDKEFDTLIHLIKEDYKFTGKLYRGITLLKEDTTLYSRIDYSFPQSFTRNKDIAIKFAKNNKVSTKGEINVDKKDSETTKVMMEVDLIQSGVNLFEFCKDLANVCEVLLDEDVADDLNQILSYAIEEEEVLLLPYMLSNYNESIKVYLI